MPPRSTETPTQLKAYVAHGVEFGRTDGPEPCGSCVFCGKNKFYAESSTGRWSCKVCGREGNVYTFLRAVWDACYAATGDGEYAALEQDRGIPARFLRMYGLARGFTGDWIVPGYGTKGTLVNLYRWRRVGEGRALIPTPVPEDAGDPGQLRHGYCRPVDGAGPVTWDSVEIAEGVWDAASRAWALSTDPGRADRTLVIGTPGCNVWGTGWAGLCANKAVTILYDNDHPRTHPETGTVTQAARAGVLRVSGALGEYSEPPDSVRCLVWGPDGYDPELPSGFDLRDVAKDKAPEVALAFVDALVGPIPSAWLDATAGTPGTATAAKPGTKRLTSLVCRSWGELTSAWRAAIHYTDEFEASLTFALAVTGAVTYGKNRLWGRLLGAPGTGKSMLCEAVATSSHCVMESVIKGFYSGARTTDGKDHSFAARLFDRCWVNNDADTMRTNPAREEVFAQMRDLYGGKGSKVFHNGIGSRGYEGLRFGVLWAGTPALCELDAADLGSRFLDFSFKPPDARTRREIAFSAMVRQTGNEPSKTDPYLRATRLTGGYLDHLRAKFDKDRPTLSLTQIQMARIYSYSEYVAAMRSRPPRNQEERLDVVELPTRLATQMTSLAVYSALIRGADRVDATSLSLVKRVAIDTGMGRTADIVRLLRGAGDRGMTLQEVSRATRRAIDSEADLLWYLSEPAVGVLHAEPDGVPGVTRTLRYSLTPGFANVCQVVLG